MSNLDIQTIIIDPQNSFMGHGLASNGFPDPLVIGDYTATLPVVGGVPDMQRTAALVDRLGHKINDFHVTLDSHHVIDVAHSAMWRDQDGNMPPPLITGITPDDIENRIWIPRAENARLQELGGKSIREYLIEYANALVQGGAYPFITIWPEHCLIGSPGHNIQSDLFQSLAEWERKYYATVNKITKGSNPWTEHYGALKAEVPLPSDPSTDINSGLLEVLESADMIPVSGEAASHCVMATINQIADNIGEEHLKKFYLLTDCMSPVGAVPNGPDFPAIAEQWLKDMEARGMNLTTSEEFLA